MKEDLSGKTIAVTGATSGIGLAAAMELAARGAGIVGIGRSPERCREAEGMIRKAYPRGQVRYFTADLSSQKQIRELARSLKQYIAVEGSGKLDGLINNAGTVSSWYVATEDGVELQFAVNHLAPFLLTHELMPLLMAAPAGRIITVSSGSHYKTRMQWKDIMRRKHYSCLMAYKQSKLANVMFCTELNRRLGQGARAFAADPGLVNTEIGLKGTGGLVRWFWGKRSRGGVKPAIPAAAIAYLATESSIMHSGEVYWKDCKPVRPSRYSQNREYARRLWEISERMCGIRPIEYGLGDPGDET